MIILQESRAEEVESALYDVCEIQRNIGDSEDSFKEIHRAELVNHYHAKNILPFNHLFHFCSPLTPKNASPTITLHASGNILPNMPPSRTPPTLPPPSLLPPPCLPRLPRSRQQGRPWPRKASRSQERRLRARRTRQHNFPPTRHTLVPR